MGICASNDLTPEAKAALRSEKINDKKVVESLKDSQADEAKISKLLLLGAGASGKSTLFKQMTTIYGKGFPESERKTYTNIIYSNVLSSIRVLIQNAPRYHPIDPSLLTSAQLLDQDFKEDQPVTEELAQHIKALWSDAGILAAYKNQADFQLTDSAKYYFDKIDEIGQFNYVPTEQDVLRSRAPTTGIVENAFDIDGNHFKMFDVGGQRNERKKWIHCFENVTAVLFVAAMSEYNQVLYEDETQNRLVESLSLFEEIANSKWFKNTSMILFLNKRDVFIEKLQYWPLNNYFKEYDGDGSYESGCAWMQQAFESRCQDSEKTVYTHITCATDTTNVQAVFTAVKDIIIRKNLGRVGLL